ncbi:hypothetical protein Pmani_024955 [Petrolisthes manimaculis]|uniref:Uncharacterized protein n=1 Tax=Petrolisthes manimaculis TaxID=1843537 RepID=A0AAE1P8Q9_9EUCA|nr:hypothetical protein Pmani_024955 [Petrolisthes manimaculis]
MKISNYNHENFQRTLKISNEGYRRALATFLQPYPIYPTLSPLRQPYPIYLTLSPLRQPYPIYLTLSPLRQPYPIYLTLSPLRQPYPIYLTLSPRRQPESSHQCRLGIRRALTQTLGKISPSRMQMVNVYTGIPYKRRDREQLL